MKIKHTAFLDLENSLVDRVNAGWKRLWAKWVVQLSAALEKQDWHEAYQVIDTLNTDQLITEYAQYAQTIAISSLLLGASRITDIRTSHISQHPPSDQLRNAITQWAATLTREIPSRIKRTLHKKVGQLEHDTEQSRHVIQKDGPPDEARDTHDNIQKADAEFTDILDGIDSTAGYGISTASSLLVSRLSSFGFLSEAAQQGAQYYQISAVLDEHTCPVCEALDGQIFSVDDGLQQASQIMSTDDPEALKSIAPWPDQSRDTVKEIQNADAQDLVDQGLTIPPYHPNCRCITVDIEEPQQTATPAQVEDLASDDGTIVSTAAILALLGVIDESQATPTTENPDIVLDEDGEPITDVMGEPLTRVGVHVVDSEGNAVLLNADGDPLMDVNDLPVIADGNQTVDSDGNQVMMDEYGSPILDGDNQLIVNDHGSVTNTDGEDLLLDNDGNLVLDSTGQVQMVDYSHVDDPEWVDPRIPWELLTTAQQDQRKKQEQDGTT